MELKTHIAQLEAEVEAYKRTVQVMSSENYKDGVLEAAQFDVKMQNERIAQLEAALREIAAASDEVVAEDLRTHALEALEQSE